MKTKKDIKWFVYNVLSDMDKDEAVDILTEEFNSYAIQAIQKYNQILTEELEKHCLLLQLKALDIIYDSEDLEELQLQKYQLEEILNKITKLNKI